jgi:hypothetical protein
MRFQYSHYFAAIMLCLASLGCGAQKFSVEEESKNFGQQVTYNSEVDVLWVVDTSASMKTHQDLLASQVPLFIEGLNATGLDYQIGVTTMDMSSSGARGRLLAQTGTPRILKKSTPNLIGLLAGRIQAGEGGSPVERGREAMLEALRLSRAGGANDGFLRANSLLNVIFLTNEEDQSDDSVNYVSALDAFKPLLPYGDRSWLAHFMGVTSSDSACKSAEWGYASPGLRYIDLATASAGSQESICDADFKRALTNVRSRVLEVLTDFPLEREPKISTIRVYVDGTEVPKSDTQGWSYRQAANSIRFHGSAIPKAGSRIKVDFDPVGLK